MKRLVLILRAGLTDLSEQAENGSLRRARHATGCPDGITFHQGADDLCSPFGAQLAHGYIMPDRSSIANRKRPPLVEKWPEFCYRVGS